MKYFLIAFSFIFLITCCTNEDDPNKKPEDNRFTEVTLARGLDEPMEMTFLPNNKVLVVERKGGIKLINEDTKETFDAGWIEVNTKYTNKEGRTREAEEGLMGVVADPNFVENNWIYMYYADPETPKHVLARWEFVDDYLVEDSKKVILEVPTQREECCHTGGGMTWDPQGNLYLTVGNNTVNPRSGASNLNELPDHTNEDDQRAPGNSMDLRGKILRIKPQVDGTYEIPEGNLFPVGMEKTRPEIYTMGHRNPWRPTIDTKTGYLYWGEVGPDASKDSIWGPEGYDEFNQAKKAGYFGWPYLIGNNRPYNSYNSEDGTYGEAFDPEHLVNNSVNNTGIKELPEAVPAFLYYPYGPSKEFPLMGTSGRSATGGPVYRKADYKNAKRPWPSYYEGKWLITEFMRGWIIAVTMDENGDYKSMEKVLPERNFSGAIDMDMGPSGDLYILEYGTTWFKGNANSRLVKIEYNSGNRKPMVAAKADVSSGKLPLTVNFSADGTIDYDENDQLTYQWKINKDGANIGSVSGEEASYTFDVGGDYEVVLEVTDSEKEMNSQTLFITAGNEAPKVELSLDKENKSFYFGEKGIQYSVKVTDTEDGEVGSGISEDEVAVTFDYVPSGYDPIEMAANQASADELASFAVGKNLIESSDCISCHQFNEKSIGPSYAEVRARYPNNKKSRDLLVDKVINGGSGVWGEHAMSAHPDLSNEDASRMVDFILSMKGDSQNRMGLTGKLNPVMPDFETEQGSFVLRAAYKDKGGSEAKALMGQKILVLKSPYLEPQNANYKKGTEILTAARNAFYAVGDKAHIGYSQVDLTGIKTISTFVSNSSRSGAIGGYIELHLGSPDGEVIAKSTEIGLPKDTGFRRPPAGVNRVEWRRQNSEKAIITLPENISGFQDVYLVFRNENAAVNDYLMQVVETGFFTE